jgi:hypothetical protein
MEDREMVRWLAVSRICLGVALLLAPSTVLRAVLGRDAARAPAGKWLGRILGGRDLLIGAGTFTAYREERQVGRWCRYGMVADFCDGVSTLLAYRQLRPRRRFLALAAAAGGTATGAYLSSRLPD